MALFHLLKCCAGDVCSPCREIPPGYPYDGPGIRFAGFSTSVHGRIPAAPIPVFIHPAVRGQEFFLSVPKSLNAGPGGAAAHAATNYSHNHADGRLEPSAGEGTRTPGRPSIMTFTKKGVERKERGVCMAAGDPVPLSRIQDAAIRCNNERGDYRNGRKQGRNLFSESGDSCL